MTDLIDFVGLQSAYKMPLDGGAIFQNLWICGFLNQFLDVVFSEMALTNRVGFKNCCEWLCFANGNQKGLLHFDGLKRDSND